MTRMFKVNYKDETFEVEEGTTLIEIAKKCQKYYNEQHKLGTKDS